jgi:hypothetical protein
LGRSAWASTVASKFSPTVIELQKFCQTWWLLKVQLLLALIVMTWALVLLALQWSFSLNCCFPGILPTWWQLTFHLFL